VPSNGASGGLLVAWNDNQFKGEVVFASPFALSMHFTACQNNKSWYLTTVYGPCQGTERVDFINWLTNIQMPADIDWLIMGDFNYIRYPSNRTSQGESSRNGEL
jgi:hypothetical protein